MLKRMYIKLFSLILFAACSMSMLSSCSETVDGSVEKGLVTLKVTLPQDEVYDMGSPASRTGSDVPPESDESKISVLKFFIFNGTSNLLEEYRSITFDGAGVCTDPMWDSTKRTLRITVTPGAKKIYCLANWTDGDPGMTAIAEGVANVADLTGRTRTHTNIALSNPPVMTGLLETSITGSETVLSISLRRQIARVELAFKLSDVLSASTTADIRIKGVKFLKLPAASYVFPQSAVATPSGTPWGQTAFAGATSAQLTGSAVAYGKYYIPENAPVEANATIMVISASYNDAQTYYSIVLNPADLAEAQDYSHVAYAIERNHTYLYTVTVEGIGVATAPTRGVTSGSDNITYKLEIK